MRQLAQFEGEKPDIDTDSPGNRSSIYIDAAEGYVRRSGPSKARPCCRIRPELIAKGYFTKSEDSTSVLADQPPYENLPAVGSTPDILARMPTPWEEETEKFAVVRLNVRRGGCRYAIDCIPLMKPAEAGCSGRDVPP